MRGLPVWALILDVLGTLLIAAGIYGIVSGELPFAEGLEAGWIAVALILAGAVLMMPLVVVLVQRAAAARK
jgi:hydrogenase-4 membrane subunit HyfE